MCTMEIIMKLQENYDIVRECNKILKDGSNIYLLKKLKHDFESSKDDFLNKENTIKELRSEFEKLSSLINSEKKELEKNEEMLQASSKGSYKMMSNLQSKIEGSKIKLKQLEDESMKLLEEEEKISLEKELLRVNLVNLKESFYNRKTNINSNITEAQKDLVKAKNEIDQLKQELPEKVILKFDSLADRLTTAVSKLEGGMCSSCRMKVSALTIDSIYKGAELPTCNNCGRFLYFKLTDLSQAK